MGGATVGLGSGLSDAVGQKGLFERDYARKIQENQQELRVNNQRIEREHRGLREMLGRFLKPRYTGSSRGRATSQILDNSSDRKWPAAE